MMKTFQIGISKVPSYASLLTFYLFLLMGGVFYFIVKEIDKRGFINVSIMWRTPTLLERLKCESESENNQRKRSWGMFPNS
jgi:hypothetical protein